MENHTNKIDVHTVVRAIKAVQERDAGNDVSIILVIWAHIIEEQDINRRIVVLYDWRQTAPQLFESEEDATRFANDCDLLAIHNHRLLNLFKSGEVEIPQVFNSELANGLNEIALLWSDKHVTAEQLFALAHEHNHFLSHLYAHGKAIDMITQILRAPRFEGKMHFSDFYHAAHAIMMAEHTRQLIGQGKMEMEPIRFLQFALPLRNACFDLYIRHRVQQIKDELSKDNSRLLLPTEDECLNLLYQSELKCYTTQASYVKNNQVLTLMKYFIQYLHTLCPDADNPTSTTTVASVFPMPNKYTQVVEWLNQQKKQGTDYFALAGNDRTEMCRQLTKLFGWHVSENSLRKAQERAKSSGKMHK